MLPGDEAKAIEIASQVKQVVLAMLNLGDTDWPAAGPVTPR
jgi:hypothetical protein